jgi:hypothetical protein
MGRYYSGDINGKFWFAVQSSTAADRFGSRFYEPNYVCYSFTTDELPDCEAEILNIEQSLGDKLATMEKFFSEARGYSSDNLQQLGVTNQDVKEYADLLLGREIRDCIKENGECNFDAEI